MADKNDTKIIADLYEKVADAEYILAMEACRRQDPHEVVNHIKRYWAAFRRSEAYIKNRMI